MSDIVGEILQAKAHTQKKMKCYQLRYFIHKTSKKKKKKSLHVLIINIDIRRDLLKGEKTAR